jgi:hypothetical protein
VQPLIPKVKPGDVLRGTKHLRRWLKTAGLLRYLQSVAGEDTHRGDASGYLYSPSKGDKFLVTVNTSETFGVYSEEKNGIALIFPAVQGASNSRGVEKGITPTTFSQWFIRTDVRFVNAQKWPLEAYYMWVSLQLDMQRAPSESRPTFHQGGDPFNKHCFLRNWGKSELMLFASRWISRGATRSPPKKLLSRLYPGPRLTDIEQMQRSIQEICANPRTLQKIKKDAKIDSPPVF